MPPTRGHDLKQYYHVSADYILGDAPHTGARLETQKPPKKTKEK